MKNTIKITAFVLLLCWGDSVLSQGKGRDKIKALKIAYITEQLELSSKEAQEFWPIYNSFQEKMMVIRRSERKQFGNRANPISDVSDSEATKMLSTFTNLQEEKQELTSKLIADLKGVIPDKKTILLLRAEESFKRKLLQQYHRRQGKDSKQ